MEKQMYIIQLMESAQGVMNTEQRSCFFKRAITREVLSNFCIKVYLAKKWETWVEIPSSAKKNQPHSCFPEECTLGKSLGWDTFAADPLNEKHGAASFLYVFHTVFQMLSPAGTAFEFSSSKIAEVSQKAPPDFILALPAHSMLRFITELKIRLMLSHRKMLIVANIYH